LYYPKLKPLLSYLSRISISSAKLFMRNVFVEVFTNFRKYQSIVEVFWPLVFDEDFKIFVKFYGFKILVNYHDF